MGCPHCRNEDNQVKAGFNVSGSQRVFCKTCQRVYTPKPACNGYPDRIRRQAKALRKQGLSYRAIGRFLTVGSQTVANWVTESDQTDE